MAFVVADRVSETTTSTGTGTIALAGAAPGYQSFAAIGNGNSTYYTIASQSQWEVGIGTYTGTTLSRDVVLSSSNSGALVNFSAGTKDVFCSGPSEGVALGLQGMVIHQNVITVSQSIPSGYNSISAGPMTVANGVTVTIPDGSSWVITG